MSPNTANDMKTKINYRLNDKNKIFYYNMLISLNGGNKMKMTSAYANKLLKRLNEDKEFWLDKESNGYVYEAALDEEPLLPDYDYTEVSKNIEELDEKIARIKHAINLANTTNQIQVGKNVMTADIILVRMAQLNKRKATLDSMRKLPPKSRISSDTFIGRKTTPEYRYINFDLNLVKEEYERIDNEIAQMQIALDKYNQTVEFEVEV